LVRSNVESLREEAPDGYRPVVDVFLLGRPEPVRVGQAQTRRDDFPWTLLIAEINAGGDEPLSPDDSMIFVQEHHIERIELRFVPIEPRALDVGFTHRVIDEGDATNSQE
jgi:hypothetical protein